MELILESAGCEAGAVLPLLSCGQKSCGHRLLSGSLPTRVGSALSLVSGSNTLFTICGSCWLPDADDNFGRAPLLQSNVAIESGQLLELHVSKAGNSIAIITLSDKGAAGMRKDTAGSSAATLLSASIPASLVSRFLLPDSASQLRALLLELALEQEYDLVCTCGGTGLGPRDITPQATSSLLDLELPGFGEAMRAASLKKTPNAIISRAVCGAVGKCLIINLPGSRRAVEENLAAILPALDHALRKLQGDSSDCGATV